MKKWMYLGLFTLVMVGTLTLNSCKKNESVVDDIETIGDNSKAEMHYDLMYEQVDDAATASGISSRGKLYNVTFDTVGSAKRMTLDWGSTNVLCADNVYRRGQIVVTWTGRYRDAGTIVTITPTDFYQNDIKVEGSKVVENKGRDANNNMYWSINVTGKLTFTDGSTFSWNSARIRTWTKGESTKLIRLDDEYEITGSMSGLNRKNEAFTATITKVLTVAIGCQYHIVSGVLDFEKNSNKTTIDYGSGVCDNTITVTRNGVTRTITKK